MPAVSVVIPTYNRKALLLEAIASVFGQTYRNYEVIVVDDDSTDGTREALMSFGERVRYISPAPSAAIARNRGIHESRARYVAFLDSDDLWEPDFLAITMTYLNETPRMAMVCTAWRSIPGGRKEPRFRRRVVAGDLFPLLLRRSLVNTSGVVAKRECLEEVGCFDESLPTAEDYDMWLRLTSAFPATFLNVPLVRRRKHPDSLSGNRVLLKESALRTVESLYHCDKIPRSVYHRLRSDLYISMGRAYMKSGDLAKGKACFREAASLTPYRLRPRRYLWFALLAGRRGGSESVRTE